MLKNQGPSNVLQNSYNGSIPEKDNIKRSPFTAIRKGASTDDAGQYAGGRDSRIARQTEARASENYL